MSLQNLMEYKINLAFERWDALQENLSTLWKPFNIHDIICGDILLKHYKKEQFWYNCIVILLQLFYLLLLLYIMHIDKALYTKDSWCNHISRLLFCKVLSMQNKRNLIIPCCISKCGHTSIGIIHLLYVQSKISLFSCRKMSFTVTEFNL